jgi:hypothetical protein
MDYVLRAPAVGQANARSCAHSSTVTERTPEDGPHHARLKCAHCGTFLKFLPKPANVQRWQLNGSKLAKLQMCDGLSTWARGFIESLAKLGGNYSPKQQEWLDKLCTTHLKGGGSNE